MNEQRVPSGMIKTPQFSTMPSPLRYGGLLVCGANYGLGAGDEAQPEGKFKPWGKYFTHSSNKEKDRFVSRIAVWFTWWGVPLEKDDGNPTDLNHAISQTNLFYHSSKSFGMKSSDDTAAAFRRLMEGYGTLNASGLLVASSRLLYAAQQYLGIGEWETKRSGRFWVAFGKKSNARVAVCPHPGYPLSQKDVGALAGDMRPWIGSVMRDYRQKQAKLSKSS